MAESNKEMEVLRNEIEALKRQNALYAMILNHVDETIFVEDDTDSIIFYNKETEIMENRSISDILGKKTDDVFPYTHAGLGKNADVNWDEWKKKKEPLFNLRYSIHMKDGVDILCLVDIYPFYYNDTYAGAFLLGTTPKLLKESQQNAEQRMGQLFPSLKIKRARRSVDYHLDDIIGESKEIKSLIGMAKRISLRDSTVMLIGETGTGKELFAQGIHYCGPYNQEPFVSVNCAAIPESLLESELFGTVKGAFTGATDAVGLFEYAENGTIFLDEINSMPLSLQAKLLRVVEEKKVRRVGSRKEIPINCRIITATNTNLFQAGREFRPDLLFRLAVVSLSIPPLRERRGDIILLAEHFLQKFNRRFSTSIQKMDESLQHILINYSWPGNVRELENLIEYAMNFVNDNETTLKLEHFPPNFHYKFVSAPPVSLPDFPETATLNQILQVTERSAILRALENCHWNITQTAAFLGLSRQNMQNKMKKHNISKP